MRGEIACYTAVTNDYDELRIPPTINGVDFIAFTDTPMYASVKGWQPRELPVLVGAMTARMRAKMPKLLPHRVLPEYSFTIWLDASHEIKSATFANEMFVGIDSGIALHKHPWRDCIYDEATKSRELWKYGDEPLEQQVSHYRAEGYPEHAGLYACGSIARQKTERITEAMESWWTECLNWSAQDQISFPVVMRRHGITPEIFPHHQVFGNPWFTIHDHPRPDE